MAGRLAKDPQRFLPKGWGRDQGILVAMSGGVDSSVAAGLLAETGVPTMGATLKVFCYGNAESSPKTCCSLESIEEARRCAYRLGMKHYVLDMEESFSETVLDDFVAEYSMGRTPNPCVRCNSYVKFGTLLKWVDEIGFHGVATGHYVRKILLTSGEEGFKWLLARGRDRLKDQSYVLWGLKSELLERFVFPLGDLEKGEVRLLAAEMQLPTAEKPESQDICFVKEGHYTDFIRERSGGDLPLSKTGPIRTGAGEIIGRHKGLIHYTVGQRRGLGLSSPTGRPYYVIRLDPLSNGLWVGDRLELQAWGLAGDSFNRLAPSSYFAGEELKVQIRAHHDPVAVKAVEWNPSGEFQVQLNEPAESVSPGQSAVLYQGDLLIGGGRILTALDRRVSSGK
ncbi:MAG: tRNA 2-thiouridine(34) synthase MnmA [Candidatus Eisenbacteria bacterium]|uniref:tRNA-specific 2-thiouridylase MnmA n=1 Tax=Eiseniibacteriota bacterium TaxID=2212470 RepID=A0A948WB58_UNCEI|nr:tRNA 2-thiouridine(34) synthase MnmA [Candidatus Eisenbacteria bacterium]MBU1948200.1 tRNA 2-thiouridine(34) synthase MnmA [Candidatus Eisenbacteria bacterium]MBU2689663.1 tRNA 2-thiouridine(34) synthase MnmA [Candidatus Eisenbacteria bacterium]